jgi:hypothetical protein
MTAIAQVLALCCTIATAQPLIVGPGVISTADDEFGGSISPDGATIYFDRSVPAHYLYTMWYARRRGGVWGAPHLLPFSGRWRDSDPVLSPDGRTMLFASDRPIDGRDHHRFAIWTSTLGSAGWNAPSPIRGPVNDGGEVFASLAADGTLYFSSDRDGTFHIYRARRVAGRYPVVEKLPASIDAPGAYIAEAFVAPDQSFLLLGIYGAPDGYGNYDIYVSFRDGAGWRKPQNLGPIVNTPAREYSPRVTPDGKYLIFTSERGFGTRPARVPYTYATFVSGERGIFDGYGNIYRIPLAPILDPLR